MFHFAFPQGEEDGDNACLVWPLNTLCLLISDIPFKYPLKDTESGVQGVEVGCRRWEAKASGGLRILISACYRLPTGKAVSPLRCD